MFLIIVVKNYKSIIYKNRKSCFNTNIHQKENIKFSNPKIVSKLLDKIVTIFGLSTFVTCLKKVTLVLEVDFPAK